MPRKRPNDPPDNIPRARSLRQDQTSPELMFWSRVKARRLQGLKFRRQHPLGPYTADFYCPDAQMVVELDGKTHGDRIGSDRARDVWMQERGMLVVRIPVWKLSKDPDVIIGKVGRIALERAEALRKK